MQRFTWWCCTVTARHCTDQSSWKCMLKSQRGQDMRGWVSHRCSPTISSRKSIAWLPALVLIISGDGKTMRRWLLPDALRGRLPENSDDPNSPERVTKGGTLRTTLNTANYPFQGVREAVIPWEQPKSLASVQCVQVSFPKSHCYWKITPLLIILEAQKSSPHCDLRFPGVNSSVPRW